MERMHKRIPHPSVTAITEGAAGRLRGKLAEYRIRQNEVMFVTGWSKTTAWRKLNGKTALDIDDMAMLWQAYGISPIYLMTGDNDKRPYPAQDGDQVSGLSSVRSREGARPDLRLVVSNADNETEPES